MKNNWKILLNDLTTYLSDLPKSLNLSVCFFNCCHLWENSIKHLEWDVTYTNIYIYYYIYYKCNILCYLKIFYVSTSPLQFDLHVTCIVNHFNKHLQWKQLTNTLLTWWFIRLNWGDNRMQFQEIIINLLKNFQ